MSGLVTVTRKSFNGKFTATVAMADTGCLKSLRAFLKKGLYHMLVKFEQNCMVQTTQNFELFDEKQTNKQTKQNKNGFYETIFDKALTPFLSRLNEVQKETM